MTNLLFSKGIKAVTGELNVKFHQSVPCTAEITVSAGLTKAVDPLYLVNAELHFQQSLMASAQAKFMRTV
jgi:acyl-coenzyme A thioesterase PaaI-like protein